MTEQLDLPAIRLKFPALSRMEHGQPVAYFDGPAGSQVPQSVADAVAAYLLNSNANRGAPFATSRATDQLFRDAHQAAADFVGASDPRSIVFGPNMTSLTLTLSRTLSRTWKPGDEILVSRLDHDANVTPWVLAAAAAGVTVRHIDINLDDCTLDWNSFESQLSPRTRLVAVGFASNAVGTINPADRIVTAAQNVGALTFIDAVHYAPHRMIDVTRLNCDFLVCSAYKFFGPHIGVLYGRPSLLEALHPDKLRPSPDQIPDRWMTGTQNHEGLAGLLAAIQYLASLAGDSADGTQNLRQRLAVSYSRIDAHERRLATHFLHGLRELQGFRLWGISDERQLSQRVSTFSLTHHARCPRDISESLARRGLWTWPGNHYALPFTSAAGLEPGGTLRIGLLHYNTLHEVDRLLTALRDVC